MQIDEEFKNLIPALSEEEYKQLEENIIKEGCREPIIVWNNVIIDGHNRYEICNKHNISFKTIDKDFESREETKIWIIKNQFGRRNLSKYDRGRLAIKIKETLNEKAKIKEQKRKQNSITDFVNIDKVEAINARKDAAKMVGISDGQLAKIEKIEKEAPKTVNKAVESNLISINKGYEITKQLKEVPKEEKEERGNELINQYLNKEFKKIEDTIAVQKNIHNAVYKILTTDITEEELNIWYEGLDRNYLETLEDDITRAIEQYKTILKFIKEKQGIRRVK